MARNNQARTGVRKTPTAASESDPPVEPTSAPTKGTLSYVSPTEFVELPSGGRYYPPGHALYKQDTVEIRYMTARDEDILTSQTLLRKGLAIDRLLENLLINEEIQVNDLLVGDKSALILAARISGYGADYQTKVTCPGCNAAVDHSFDLNDVTNNPGNVVSEGIEEVEITPHGTFVVTLPKTQYKAEFRLLTGHDERYLSDITKKKTKLKLPDAGATDLLKRLLISINDVTNGSEISDFIDNMPALDSRFLRAAVVGAAPHVDMSQFYSCSNCGYESEMEVPLTADFFWPG
jgi:transcription elongation factor Elf1